MAGMQQGGKTNRIGAQQFTDGKRGESTLGDKAAGSQHSIPARLIVVINSVYLLIQVIASANHRRHRQGWHSGDPQRRQRPEFAGTLHHPPTELETGGGEKNAKKAD